jgi:hypothetical protein
MLTTKVASNISNKMKKLFGDIGAKNGTEAPPSKNNSESIAWEYYVAFNLASMAEARKKAAIQECIKAGVLFDHTKNPAEPGTERSVFNGENITINLKVSQSTPIFDSGKLKGVLLRHRISSEVADKIYDECLKDRAPSHTFRPVPVVGD